MKNNFGAALALVFFAGCWPQTNSGGGASPLALEQLAPHAAAICLAEVTAIREVDERPYDGDLTDVAELRVLKLSGEAPGPIRIIKEYGGMRPPETVADPAPLPGPVRPGSLQEGRRYWFAFSSQYEHASGKYPQGVIAFWEENAPQREVLAQAIREDRFAWNPQYYAASGLTHGDQMSREKREWTIRVYRDDKLLWEQTRRGVKARRYLSFGFIPARSIGEEPQNATADDYLLAEAAELLPENNDYDLPAGEYYVKHAHEVLTGSIKATWISELQEDGYVERAFRRFK